MRRALFFLAILVAGTGAAAVYVCESQVVGYVNSEIKQGVNEIRIMMDGMDLFPTLDNVLRFDPPQNVVGDEIIFDLDGKHRKYRIEFYDGVKAVMKTKQNLIPPVIGLDWIPLRETVWLNHVSTNRLTCGSVGEVNAEVTRKMITAPKMPRRQIEIRVVGDDAQRLRILFGEK